MLSFQMPCRLAGKSPGRLLAIVEIPAELEA